MSFTSKLNFIVHKYEIDINKTKKAKELWLKMREDVEKELSLMKTTQKESNANSPKVKERKFSSHK